MPNNQDLPIFIRFLGDAKSVTTTAADVKKTVKTLAGDFQDLSQKAGLAFAGAGAGLLAFGGATIKVAGQFQQLEARLNSIVKDSQRAHQIFVQSASLAPASPFSVQQMVQASVTLTAFRQNAQRSLPAVADLAAATGARIEDIALAMSKALNGVSEGYQSLRDVAGIQFTDLEQRGAILNSDGGVSLKDEEQREKARKALLQYVQETFSGAAAEQSKTFEGALSNVGDTIEQVANDFSQSLLPAATGVLRVFEAVVNVTKVIPAELKGVIAGTAVVTGALTLMAGGALLVGGQFTTMLANVVALRGAIPALGAVLKVFEGTLAGVTNFARANAAALSGLAKGVGVLGAALAIGEIGISLYAASWDKVEESTRAQLNTLQKATKPFKDYSNAINQVTGEKFISGGRDVAKTAEEVQKAFSSIQPADMVSGLEKAGISLAGARKALEDNATAAEEAEKKYKLLKDLVGQGETTVRGRGGIVLSSSVEIPEELRMLFDGKASVGIEEAKKALGDLEFETQKFASTSKVLEQVVGTFEKFQKPLSDAVESAQRLNTVLKFTNQAKDSASLGLALQETTSELVKFQNVAKDQGLPTTRLGLERQLLTATGTRAAFIKAYLELMVQQEQAEERLSERQRDIEQERVTQLDRRHERAKNAIAIDLNGNEQNLQAEREYLEQRLALVDGATKQEQQLTKELNTIRGGVGPLSPAQDERAVAIERQLVIVRKQADEEIKTRQQLKATKKQILQQEVKDVQESLQSGMQEIQEFRATAGDATGQELVAQYDFFLQRLEAFGDVNRDLIAQSRDLGQAYKAAHNQLEQLKTGATRQAQTETLQAVRQQLQLQLADEVNTQARRQLIVNTIADLEGKIARHLVEQKAGEAEINQLKREQAQLNKQLDAEGTRDSQDILAGQLQAFDQEIAILEERKLAGEHVELRLQQLREQRLQAALAAIELEAIAEQQSTGKTEVVQQKKSQRIMALLRDEYLAQLRQHNQLQQAQSDHYSKLDQMAEQRVGGKRSPLKKAPFSDDPNSSFSLGDFDLDAPFRKLRVPTPQELMAKRGFNPTQSDALRTAAASVTPAQIAGGNTSMTVNFYVDGVASPVPVKQIAEEAIKYAEEETRKRGLIHTSQSPPSTRGQRR